MTHSSTVGLIGSGKAVRSSLIGLPGLAENLGPVKASSFRVARRIVNAIRAGEAVYEVDALRDCSVILLCIAEEFLDGAVLELEASGLDLVNRVIVIIDSARESGTFTSLLRRQARVASIFSVSGATVAEGDSVAVREFRRWLMAGGGNIISLEPGGKPCFLAAVTMAGLTTHFSETVGGCLREAGLSPSQSRVMVERLMSEALRSWTKAGQKSLDTRWDEERWAAIRDQEVSLKKRRPELAAFFSSVVHAAGKPAGKRPASPKSAGTA